MEELQLNLLTEWQLRSGGTDVRLPYREQRVLACVAITGPAPRRRIAGALWPDNTEANALESLRVSIHHISRGAPGVLDASRERLALAAGVCVDLAVLHRDLVLLAAAGADVVPEVVPGAVQTLLRADLLPGWDEAWLNPVRDELRDHSVRLLESLAMCWLDAGQPAGALQAAAAALHIEPLSERAARIVALAQTRIGNHAVAVSGLRRFIRRISEELGVLPTEELLETLESLGVGRVAAPPGMKAGTTARRPGLPF